MAFVKKYIGFFLLIFVFVLLMVGLGSDYNTKSPQKGVAYNPYAVSMYNRSGQVNQQMKVLCDTLTPSTATSQTISIASAGFTKILSATVTAARNTTTIGSMPLATIQSCTTSTLTVNIIDPNMSLITILGSGVLLGGSAVTDPTPSTITLNIIIIGY